MARWRFDLKSPWWVLLTVSVGTAMPIADTTSMNVGRFFITRALDSSSDEIRWVVGGYSLFVALGIPLSHRLRAFFEERTLFVLATLSFMGGSVISLLSNTMPLMMLGRALQGLSGGILLPLSVSLIQESFPAELRGKALALFSFANALAVSIGPTVGGYLLDNAGWRWPIGIHIPLGFMTLLLAHLTIENHPWTDPRRFDFVGIGLFSVAVFVCFYWSMEGERFGWHSNHMFAFHAVWIVLGLLYVWWALTVRDPIVPLDTFRSPGFLVLSVVNVLRSVSAFGRLGILPIWLETFYHFQSHHAGELILMGALVELSVPMLGLFIAGNPVMAWAGLGTGSLLVGFSSLAYINLPVSTFTLALTEIPQLVFGVGFALVQVSIAPLVQDTLPPDRIRVGTVTQLVLMFLASASAAVLSRHWIDDLTPDFFQMLSQASRPPLSPESRAAFYHLAQGYAYNLDFWILGLMGVIGGALSLGYLLFFRKRSRRSPVRTAPAEEEAGL